LVVATAHYAAAARIIIIIIKAICSAQDPLKKAANALSGSLKMLVSIYYVSYKQQCLQLCPKGRETTVRHSQQSGQAVPHRMLSE